MSSLETTFAVISFLMKKIILSPLLSRSRKNGVPKPSKKKLPFGKESYNLGSNTIKILILPLIISGKELSLFQLELILRCKNYFTKIVLFLNFKTYKLRFTSEFAFSRVSNRQPFTVTKRKKNISLLFI